MPIFVFIPKKDRKKREGRIDDATAAETKEHLTHCPDCKMGKMCPLTGSFQALVQFHKTQDDMTDKQFKAARAELLRTMTSAALEAEFMEWAMKGGKSGFTM